MNGTDPLSDGLFGEEVDVTPPVDACDLVSYLVLQTSFVTAKQFKARKGLEAYKQFVCGWVKEIKTRKVADKYLTTGRVSSYFVQLLALFLRVTSTCISLLLLHCIVLNKINV